MFDIMPVEVDVPAMLEPVEEVNSIVHEFSLGVALREVALFRLWRMWRDSAYTEIESDDMDAAPGQPKFGTFGDFLKFFTDTIEVSRAKVYSRLKCYSLLDYLHFTDKEMVVMMATKPTLYDRALNLIFIWDQESRLPTGLKTDYFGDDVKDETVKTKIRNFLIELAQFDRVQDALSMLTHDVLGKPTVRVYMLDRKMVVSYDSVVVDEDDGVGIVGENGEIVFEPNEVMPEWVLNELQRKFAQR